MSTIQSILIADAGATRTDWVLVSCHGEKTLTWHGPGINAIQMKPDEIDRRLADIKSDIAPSAIHFYGAGCSTPQICDDMADILRRRWPSASEIEVSSDLLASARAMLADSEGIVGILGTGSNSGLYDGTEIVFNIPSLGYILGDEGSGASLGRRVISDWLKGILPEDIADMLSDSTGLTIRTVLENTYRSNAPAAFLGSVVPFLARHINHPAIEEIVSSELGRYFDRNIALYRDAHSLPLVFTGGIASTFERQLREEASSRGLNIAAVMHQPLEALKSYHVSHSVHSAFEVKHSNIV